MKVLDGDLAAILADPAISTETKRERFLQHRGEHKYRLDLPVGDTEQYATSPRFVLARPMEEGKAVHIVTSEQKEPLQFVARMRMHHGDPQELWLATLGFQPHNIRQLSALLDDLPKLTGGVLVSDFFLLKSRAKYEAAKEALAPYRDRFPLATLHVHAKIAAAAFSDRHYTIYGSSNLCHCERTEQYTITTRPELFDFHKGWITDTLQYANR